LFVSIPPPGFGQDRVFAERAARGRITFIVATALGLFCSVWKTTQ
jgi:hypothetical protein